jgi:hypothetical protein
MNLLGRLLSRAPRDIRATIRESDNEPALAGGILVAPGARGSHTKMILSPGGATVTEPHQAIELVSKLG